MIQSPLNSITEQERMQVPDQTPEHAAILIFADMTDTFLKSFELRFDSDESSVSRDEMQHYILSATYMKGRYGRKHIVARVQEVYSSLPF